jgi:hypothetical protein
MAASAVLDDREVRTSSTRSTRYWVAVIGILALTIFLRFWRLDLIQFKDDQATLLRLAEDIVRLGRVPLAGMTSSLGVPVAPTFEYLLAPIVAINRDPRVATAAIGLMNVAGVAGTILFGWRRFSRLAGLLAGLVYAANPWAVFFSRKVWSNDVVAPTAVVWLFCLDNAIVGGQAAWAVAAFPVFALGVEFHPSFVLLTPLLLVLGALMIKRRQLKHLAAGLAMAAITTVPYLIFNFQTDWSYLDVLASTGPQSQRVDAAGPAEVLGLIDGWRNWNVEGLDIQYLLPLRLAAVPGAIETLLLAIGIAAALLLVFRSRQSEQRLRAAGLLVWLAVPMLLTIRHSIPLYDYYFLFVLPVGALLIGLGIHTLADLGLARRTSRMLVGITIAATIGVAAIQSAIVLRELGYLTDGYVLTYGPPLQAGEQTTRELIDQAKQSGARQLSVEIDDVNEVSIGYLARPYIPEVKVVERRRGPWDVNFDLPAQSASVPYAFVGPPQLTAPRSLDVSYTDGVRALSVSTSSGVTPGESVGVALAWTIEHHSPTPLTNRLVWEVSLYDPSGREVRRLAGRAHDWAQIADGEVVLSWLTAATGTDATPGTYQVHINRLDPVSATPEWNAGALEMRRN